MWAIGKLPVSISGTVDIRPSSFFRTRRWTVFAIVIIVTVGCGFRVIDSSAEMRGQDATEGGRGFRRSFAAFGPRIDDLNASLLKLGVKF